ncbi:MAG: PqqD family protein [Anaerolineae bacterium]|nr:PqqD family protein [Anaerolineae bacterium]
MLLSQKPRPKPDYRLELMDGELLLYHPGQTKIFYCNPTASLIWHLCDGQRTVKEITALLRQAFPAAASAIAADVEATLQQFAAHGAIEFE